MSTCRWWIGCVAALASTMASAQQAAKVTVPPTFEAGRTLRYQLKLAGATAWAPTLEGVSWGKMQTDFTLALATKAVRTKGLHKGCCTFQLLGEHLRLKNGDLLHVASSP